MRTEDLEHELLADPLVALPREVAERLALNVAERFGIPIISVATARELDRLYGTKPDCPSLTPNFRLYSTRSR